MYELVKARRLPSGRRGELCVFEVPGRLFGSFLLRCLLVLNRCHNSGSIHIRSLRNAHALTSPPSSNLMSDPKARKVIVIESPLLPTQVKEMIARVLFDNLQVRPSLLPRMLAHPPNAGPLNQLRLEPPPLPHGNRNRHWSRSRLRKPRNHRPPCPSPRLPLASALTRNDRSSPPALSSHSSSRPPSLAPA